MVDSPLVFRLGQRVAPEGQHQHEDKRLAVDLERPQQQYHHKQVAQRHGQPRQRQGEHENDIPHPFRRRHAEIHLSPRGRPGGLGGKRGICVSVQRERLSHLANSPLSFPKKPFLREGACLP